MRALFYLLALSFSFIAYCIAFPSVVNAQGNIKEILQGAQCLESEKPVTCLQNLIISVDHDLAFYQDLGKSDHLISKSEFITQLALIYLDRGNETQAFTYIEKALNNIENLNDSAHAKKVRVNDIRLFLIDEAKKYCARYLSSSKRYNDCNCDAYMQDLTPKRYELLTSAKEAMQPLEKAMESQAKTYSVEEYGSVENYILSSIKRYLGENPINSTFLNNSWSDICELKIVYSMRGNQEKLDCFLRSSYHLKEFGEPMMGLGKFMSFPKELYRLELDVKIIIQPAKEEGYSMDGNNFYVNYKSIK